MNRVLAAAALALLPALLYNSVDEKGKELTGTMAYWFAWAAFHPETQIYRIVKSEKP